jgi:hypothetical protein
MFQSSFESPIHVPEELIVTATLAREELSHPETVCEA